MRIVKLLLPALFVLAACACDRAAVPETAAPADATAADAATAATTAAAAPAPDFVDKVWQVRESSAVAPGMRYSFLGDGTLVIEGAGGPPGHGRWAYADGALTMTEDGIAYPVDILALDAGRFDIRSHNPGEPVTIAFEPAVDATLPPAPPQ